VDFILRTSWAPGFERFDEMLEKEKGGLAGLDREVLLDLLALFAAEGGICEDYIEAILLLNVA